MAGRLPGDREGQEQGWPRRERDWARRQLHGSVFLDHTDTVIKPAALLERRADRAPSGDAITGRVGAQRLIEIAGSPTLTGFQAPVLTAGDRRQRVLRTGWVLKLGLWTAARNILSFRADLPNILGWCAASGHKPGSVDIRNSQ